MNGVQRRPGQQHPTRTTTSEKQRAAQDRSTARRRPRGEQAIGEALYARIRAAVKQLSRTAQGK